MASRTRLAIIGASVRAAAQSAHRAGHDVVAADLFTDEDLRSLCPASRVRCYPDGFIDWLAGVEADAWMYTGGLEQWPDLVDRLARLKPLWGNGGTPLRRVRDLETLHPILCKAGLAVPETRATPAGLPLDGSWLCKAGGSGGAAVWALDSSESLEHGERMGAHYQRRLTNCQGSAASVVLVLGDGWSRTIGVTRQLIGFGFGAKPFQYAGSYGPVKISPAVRRQLHTLEQTLREAFCLRGLVGVDLWLSNDSFWVLEVNPRYTASVEVLELAGAGPVLDNHVRAFANVDPPNPSTATPATRESAKKQILYARKSFQAPASVPHWVSAPDQGGNRFWIADVPAPDQHFDPGDPVLTVMGHGNVVDTQAFDEFVAAIERWLYAEATPTPRRR